MAMGLLFGEFLVLLGWWGRHVYRQPQPLKHYGLEGTWRNSRELFQGLGVGLTFTLTLFALEGWLGWLKFQTPSAGFPRVVLEGLVSALGIGLAEELFFRGWLLAELERDYTLGGSLRANTAIFAVLHFLKPPAEIVRTLPAFPGLLLLGVTLIGAKRSAQGRLGSSIGLHAGLVWGYYTIHVGGLVQYSNQVSPWLTGVDGNPIAGLTGLLFLSILALWMHKD